MAAIRPITINRDPAAVAIDHDRPETLTRPGRDMVARWVPSQTQYEAACAILAALPGTYAVIAPIALPGKSSSVWMTGQVVEYPPGVFIASDRDESYRAARDAASDAADRHLGARDGEVAYAVIRPLGAYAGDHAGEVHASVFDDIRMSRVRMPVGQALADVIGDDARRGGAR